MGSVDVSQACAAFDIVPDSINVLRSGLIHRTWRVDAGKDSYIVQRVASIFHPAVMVDIRAVLRHLRQKGLLVERIIQTNEGLDYLEDGNVFWRVFTYIAGKTFDSVPSGDVACAAGTLLGIYHTALQDINHTFTHVRPVKHNFSAIYELFEKTTSGKLDQPIRELARPIETLPYLLPTSELRIHVTHGDPKISNFIFNTEGTRAISLIDLDDCGKQYNSVVELGSAVRSWCQVADDALENNFSLEKFEAALHGYVKTSAHLLVEDEWKLLPNAIRALPLELAARFLTDVYLDQYFAWDETRFASRAEHNMTRFRAQIMLYQDMCDKAGEIEGCIQRLGKLVF